MASELTHGKTAAGGGYVQPDPRRALAELRTHLGLAEGHLASMHRLMRELEATLDEQDAESRVA